MSFFQTKFSEFIEQIYLIKLIKGVLNIDASLIRDGQNLI